MLDTRFAENIRFGDIKLRLEGRELKEAAALSEAYEFIERFFRQKMDTLLGRMFETGQEISAWSVAENRFAESHSFHDPNPYPRRANECHRS